MTQVGPSPQQVDAALRGADNMMSTALSAMDTARRAADAAASGLSNNENPLMPGAQRSVEGRISLGEEMVAHLAELMLQVAQGLISCQQLLNRLLAQLPASSSVMAPIVQPQFRSLDDVNWSGSRESGDRARLLSAIDALTAIRARLYQLSETLRRLP